MPATAFATLARELMRPLLRMMPIENRNDYRFSEFSERKRDPLALIAAAASVLWAEL